MCVCMVYVCCVCVVYECMVCVRCVFVCGVYMLCVCVGLRVGGGGEGYVVHVCVVCM